MRQFFTKILQNLHQVFTKNKFFTKKGLVKELEKNGVETRPLMTGNMINQPVSKYMKYKKSGKLKNADYIQENSFLIGNHHGITNEQRKFIVDVITNYIISKTSSWVYNDLLNFKEIKPTATPNHYVNNLTTIAKANAKEISISSNDKRPPKLPSVTPFPACNIETAPNITDVE